jgi:galactokinase
MMGGGFGGCTINLVKTDEVPTFINEITLGYQEKFGKTPSPIEVNISDGVKEIAL